MICTTPLQPWHWAQQTGTDCPAVMPDWVLSGGDLGRDSDLASIVMTQLFTDLRADGQRGWWGDQFQPFAIGSEMWRLEGQPLGAQAVLDAERYVREALDHLGQQGLFDTYTVDASITGKTLAISVDLISAQGASLLSTTFTI